MSSNWRLHNYSQFWYAAHNIDYTVISIMLVHIFVSVKQMFTTIILQYLFSNFTFCIILSVNWWQLKNAIYYDLIFFFFLKVNRELLSTEDIVCELMAIKECYLLKILSVNWWQLKNAIYYDLTFCLLKGQSGIAIYWR